MGIIRTLYKKEMLDIVRDKKTILIMILVPLVVYPLLVIGSMFAVSMFMSKQEAATYQVAFEQVQEQKAIEAVMDDLERKEGYLFEIVSQKQCEKALEEGDIDAYVTEHKKNRQIVYEIKYISNNNASSTAASHLMSVMDEYREVLRTEKITASGLDVDHVLYPIASEKVDLATDEESMGNLIGSLLPFIMIVSILMGAIYPAIDVTAGEKERGTLETLLTLPVSNMELITSKFLAVSTVAVVSALLNFLSVGLFGGIMYKSMAGTLEMQNMHMTSFVPAFLCMLLCVVAFAMFISALCLCVCIFAKSFKEAQNYSTPLMLVTMIVGYIGFVPDLTLNSTVALIPIANIILLIKNIFAFQYDFGNIFVVLVTNVAYSFLTVMLLSKMYRSEAVLFEEGGSVTIFERRVNIKKGQLPGIGDTFLLLAIVLLAMLSAGSLLQMKAGFVGIGIQQLMILCFTLGFVWYGKNDYKKLFSLKRPKVSKLLGSFLLWIGCYIAVILLSSLLGKVFKTDLSNFQSLQEMYMEQPAWLLFLVVAVLPPICEELLFRGFVFGTMKHKWKPVTAIVVSGILFGVYHMSPIKAVTISLFGIALAYAVYRSESIFCSMLMHFCENGLSVLLLLCPKQMEKLLPFLFREQVSVPMLVGLVAVGIVCSSMGIVLLGKKKKYK